MAPIRAIVPRGDGHQFVCYAEVSASSDSGAPQTLLCACDAGPALAPLWIGLLGAEQRLSVLLSPAPGRSPHLWHGPLLPPGQPFSFQIAIHTGMGPGGVLWRGDDAFPGRR